MTALLERASQVISATALVRGFSSKLREVSTRATDRLVIIKDNQPVAVLVNVAAYQEMLDEIEDLRLDARAATRIASFDESSAIPQAEMLARYSKD